jgi:homocysteine S-methyltransferase
MSANESADYHGFQVDVFAATAADMVSAFTMNYADEATGVVLAAKRAAIPVVISFTVETDGHLPSGQPLPEAIAQVDAASDGYAAYFMINCAHPTHFEDSLPGDAEWAQRLRGLRANSSCKSHAELDESNELDEGNPSELGQQYAALLKRHPHINILGGCCGTDHRHIAAIAQACRRT